MREADAALLTEKRALLERLARRLLETEGGTSCRPCWPAERCPERVAGSAGGRQV